jgi:rhodanese-related sulfurtransferase
MLLNVTGKWFIMFPIFLDWGEYLMAKFLIISLAALFLITIVPAVSHAQDTLDFLSLVAKNEAGEFEIKGAQKIGYKEALELQEQGILFVDVRRSTQYNFKHIPGAINLDLKSAFTEENLAKHAAKDQKTVLYCSDVQCYRSAHASANAITWGYSNVVYFAGGWSTWKTKGDKSN